MIHRIKRIYAPVLLAMAFLAGCGKEKVAEKYPNGKPKVIRTYGIWGGANPENLIREQKFYFNAHKESDAHYRKGRLDGRFEDFWHNGQKKSQGEYRDGKKEGDWESYYNQFTLSSKGRFQNGLQEGQWSSFWENGVLRSQGAYAAGKETGTWKDWSAKGEPVNENSCFAANEQGRFTSYHANKTVKEDYQCRRGVPSGSYLKRDPDGTVIERGAFDSQGRKDGTWEAFHANGKRASMMRFLGGLDQDSAYAWDDAGRLRERAHFDSGTGERVAYDSLGHLIERRRFLKGRPDGESWTYWPQGGKRALLLYKDGKPVTMQKWHPNGKPMANGVFENGHRAGEWKDWWENGTLKEVSHFQDGALHGERFFYDEKGKLLRTQKYEHGFPSSGKIPKGLAGSGNPQGTVVDPGSARTGTDGPDHAKAAP
jgi:antitoxin component YwqK of YwqJK toxin-antitoxin module